MTPLTDESRDRLVKLCGMMGSSFDGERATAALMADRLVKSMGVTWNDLIIRRHGTTGPTPAEPETDWWCDMASVAMQHSFLLSQWELQFVSSIRMRYSLTTKQEAIAVRIAARLRAHGLWA
mgnify:CR=1 FL=1